MANGIHFAFKIVEQRKIAHLHNFFTKKNAHLHNFFKKKMRIYTISKKKNVAKIDD